MQQRSRLPTLREAVRICDAEEEEKVTAVAEWIMNCGCVVNSLNHLQRLTAQFLRKAPEWSEQVRRGEEPGTRHTEQPQPFSGTPNRLT